MTQSTDVVVAPDYSPEVAALLASQEEAFNETDVQVPIIKLTQAGTREVKEGDVEAGEFFNTLTGDSYGTKIEVIVAHYATGRAASSKDGAYRNTIGAHLIPDDEVWKAIVGEEWVGTPFDEYPDAEEIYKKRVNAGEMEWGKGPLISTTYNYTLLVVDPDADEDASALDSLQMGRLSFLRSTKKAHDKIQQLKRNTMRGRPIWDVVFELETFEKEYGRNSAFNIKVRKGRATTGDERELAAELAINANAGRVVDNSEAAASGSESVAPDAAGGLAV